MNAQPNPENVQPNLGIKPTTFENPMGIDGFEFVEFASPEPEKLHAYFKMLGFTAVARHKTRKITNYRQGDCTFLINEDPDSFAAEFAKQHGPSACGFAVRVNKLAEWVRVQALKNGAEQIGELELTKAVAAPVIKGIGGCMLYIVDRYDDKGTIHDPDWEWLPGAEMMPKGLGLTFIDHLTHNLYAGNMEKWAGYYERLFNFREIRYFDIKGAKTGLLSKAMTAPDGMVRIPLNEESGKGGSGQIEEFLMKFNGEGIQHIALLCDDLIASVDALQLAGVPLMSAPNEVYYEMLEERLPGHGEPIDALKTRGILLDGSTAGGDKRLLLQIFSQAVLGPVFFEFIQRKNDEGFGEGNFKALFESLERDQIRRGALATEA